MEFRVLGNVEAVAARPVALPGKRVRALLAILLLDSGRTVPVDRIVAALWKDAPFTATRQVQHCVSLLRKALSGTAALVHTETSGYRLILGPQDTVDAHEFENLTGRARKIVTTDPGGAIELWDRALALWRGTALSDVCQAALVHRATYWDEQRVIATEDCLAAQLRLGRHREALAHLTSLASAYPLRERPTELLITALRAGGRRIEAIDQYQAFSARLCEELGLDPGARLQRLHRELLRGEEPERPEAHRDRAPGQAPAIAPIPAIPVPAELPCDLSTFTGRAELLRRLRKHLDERPSPVIAIHGIAGCGKTSLAVRLAHLITERFDDGQLYVQLRGHSAGGPLSTFAALSQMMRSLGVSPGLLPQHTDELAGRFRSAVAGRRLLIVLDDAVDASQVLPLLPGTAGCLVLITSRSELPGLAGRTDAVSVSLAPFDPDESVTLLRSFLDDSRAAEESDLRALAQLCSGLPVALRLVGERLRRCRELSVRGLVEELSGPGRLNRLRLPGDPGVRAAFDTSYRLLPEPLRRLWRVLAGSPLDSFTVHIAARLADIPESRADAALEKLSTAHLLEVTDDGRYRFHALLRIYAVERAEAEEDPQRAEAAMRRLLDWYVERVDVAYQSLSPEFPPICGAVDPSQRYVSQASAMAWLTDESTNLSACAAHAARLNLRHCWQLAIGMTNWWFHRGNHRDWISFLSRALVVARQTGDREGQWRLNHGLGLANFLLGNFAASRTHFRKAISLTQLLGRARDGLWSYSILAELELDNGRYLDAAHTLERSLSLLPSGRGSPRLEATLRRNLGYLYLRTGRPAEAVEPLRRANVLLSGINADVCRSFVEIALGQAHQALGRSQLAGRHLRQALRLLESHHDRKLRCHAHLRLGAFLAEHGSETEARAHLGTLLEHSELLNPEHVAEARKLLAALDSPVVLDGVGQPLCQ